MEVYYLDTTHSALQEQIISDKKLNDEIEAGMQGRNFLRPREIRSSQY